MNTNRRDFIKTTAITTGILGIGSLAGACCSGNSCKTERTGKDVPLHLSFQEGTPPGESLKEKFDFMEKLGIEGFEPGGRGLAGRVSEIRDALKGRSIKVSAICAGFGGWLIAEDEAQRKLCMDSSKEILAAAGELGSVGMILVPGFNGQQPSLQMPASREMLLTELKELGDFAHQHGTHLILEPLNRNEAWFLRMVADGASICRDVNSPGLKVMGDFWHMTWEETSDYGAFYSGGDYLQHVHIASRKNRLMPGEDGAADEYVSGFKALKELNYQYYVSFECGTKGDRTQTVTNAVTLLRGQWAKA